MIACCHQLKNVFKLYSNSPGAMWLSIVSISSEIVPFYWVLYLILAFTDVCFVCKDTLQNEMELPHGL